LRISELVRAASPRGLDFDVVRPRSILVLATLGSVSGCGDGGAARGAANEAWPAVDAILAAFEQKRFEAMEVLATSTFQAKVSPVQLAPIRDTVSRLLGARRRGERPPTPQEARLEPAGEKQGPVLVASWPADYERGAASIEVRAESAGDGWRVDACSIRSAAFTFVLAESR
jgi:hypothetical protein